MGKTACTRPLGNATLPIETILMGISFFYGFGEVFESRSWRQTHQLQRCSSQEPSDCHSWVHDLKVRFR